MELMILAVLLGLIPAAIAQSKGRNFLAWWAYGAALLIVALPHAIMLNADGRAVEAAQLESGDNRKCPYCAEVIKREAVVCRYCGRDLPALAARESASEPAESRRLGWIRTCPKCPPTTIMYNVGGRHTCPKCGLSEVA